MKDISGKHLIFDFWMQFLKTGEILKKNRVKEVKKQGISVLEASIIYEVGHSNNCITPAEISRNLIQEAHAISQLLERMEQRGLITRNKDLPRKNMIRIALTSEGENKFRNTKEIKSLIPIISVLTPAQIQKMTVNLKKIQQKAIEELE
jgi:DNA-binding MarR family transcriptional regulator